MFFILFCKLKSNVLSIYPQELAFHEEERTRNKQVRCHGTLVILHACRSLHLDFIVWLACMVSILNFRLIIINAGKTFIINVVSYNICYFSD